MLSLKETPLPSLATFSCRAAACIERLVDGKEWSIYLLNDEDFTFDRVKILSFGHSLGGSGKVEEIGLEINDFPSGGWLRVWRDDDFENRMYMQILIETRGQRQNLLADFPKVYRRKPILPLIEPIGLPGVVVPLE